MLMCFIETAEHQMKTTTTKTALKPLWYLFAPRTLYFVLNDCDGHPLQVRNAYSGEFREFRK